MDAMRFVDIFQMLFKYDNKKTDEYYSKTHQNIKHAEFSISISSSQIILNIVFTINKIKEFETIKIGEIINNDIYLYENKTIISFVDKKYQEMYKKQGDIFEAVKQFTSIPLVAGILVVAYIIFLGFTQ